MIDEQIHQEALSEMKTVIEDIFYVASLFRSAGDIAAANRMGDLGDKFHDEWLRVREPQSVVLS